jgi:glycosyltransferase involved in cell wall biosynthesis
MKIAQVAPLWELVPPATYGGTELVVHLLTEEMVRLGHEVTLFAAKGSQTSARLIESCPAALRAMEGEHKEDKTHCNVIAYEMGMVGDVLKRAHNGEFDIIHNHMGFQFLPFADLIDVPVVTTLHNALAPEKIKEIFLNNRQLPYISISDYQQVLWPELNYASTIHHGINLARFNASSVVDDNAYFAFLGRLSPEKGPHNAIKIAKAAGKKLLMAGKIDRVDKAYYDREIAPFVDGDQIQYIGEVNHEQKVELLRNAALTLCPIEWAEPFGLVLIESMACGTPVLALKDGSIPEIIEQNVTGYIGTSVDELIEAACDYRRFDRKTVRAVMEERFSVERMTQQHIELYEDLIKRSRLSKNADIRPVQQQTTQRRNIIPNSMGVSGYRKLDAVGVAAGRHTNAASTMAVVAKGLNKASILKDDIKLGQTLGNSLPLSP